MKKGQKSNCQTKIHGDRNLPAESHISSVEKARKHGIHRLKRDKTPLRADEELILNGLLKAKDWKQQRKNKGGKHD